MEALFQMWNVHWENRGMQSHGMQVPELVLFRLSSAVAQRSLRLYLKCPHELLLSWVNKIPKVNCSWINIDNALSVHSRELSFNIGCSIIFCDWIFCWINCMLSNIRRLLLFSNNFATFRCFYWCHCGVCLGHVLLHSSHNKSIHR